MFNAQHSRIGRSGALRVIVGTAVITGIVAATGVAEAATPLTPTPTPTPVVQSTGTGTTSTSTGSADGIVTESAGAAAASALIGDVLVSEWAQKLGLTGQSSCMGGLDTPFTCWPHTS